MLNSILKSNPLAFSAGGIFLWLCSVATASSLQNTLQIDPNTQILEISLGSTPTLEVPKSDLEFQSWSRYQSNPQFDLYSHNLWHTNNTLQGKFSSWLWGFQYYSLHNKNAFIIDNYTLQEKDIQHMAGGGIGYTNKRFGTLYTTLLGNQEQRFGTADYTNSFSSFLFKSKAKYSLSHNQINLTSKERSTSFFNKQYSLSLLQNITWNHNLFSLALGGNRRFYKEGSCLQTPCTSNNGNGYSLHSAIQSTLDSSYSNHSLRMLYEKDSSALLTDRFSSFTFTQFRSHIQYQWIPTTKQMDSLSFSYKRIQWKAFSRSPEWFFDVQKFPKEGFEGLFTLYQNEQWRNAYQADIHALSIPIHSHYKTTWGEFHFGLTTSHLLLRYKQFWKSFTTLFFLPSGEIQTDKISPLYGVTLILPKIRWQLSALGGAFSIEASQWIPLHQNKWLEGKNFLSHGATSPRSELDYNWKGGTQIGFEYQWPK